MPFGLSEYIDHVGWGKIELPNVGAPILEIATSSLSGGDSVKHVEYRHGKLYLESSYTSHETTWANVVVTKISPIEIHLRINKMRFEEVNKTSNGELKEIKCFSYVIKCTDEIVNIHGQKIDSTDLTEYITRRSDCHKNPINKPVWDLLEPVSAPKYDGNRLFITDDNRTFIAIIEGQWLEVEKSWIEKNKRSIPSPVLDELQAFADISQN